jgi:hypothetical protein
MTGPAKMTRWVGSGVAACILALAALNTALAAPQTFGDRTLEIPAPEGYVEVTPRIPKYTELAATFLPASNRLVEMYALPDQLDMLSRGEGTEINPYYQLQTLRSVDGRILTQQEFSEASGIIEKSLIEAFGTLDEDAAKLTQQGNEAVRAQTGTDVDIKLSGTKYLGAYRREPWGLFFSMSAEVASAGEAPKRQIASGAVALVNQQIVYLYAYINKDDAAARRWAEQAVSAWADQVRAANGESATTESAAEPAPSAASDSTSSVESASSGGGFDWSRVWRGALVGGLIGLAVALVRVFTKRK